MLRILALFSVVLLQAACTNLHIDQPGTRAPEPKRTTFEISRDVVVSSAEWPAQLLADVYRPLGAGPDSPRPGVLLIHGGAWKRGSRDQVDHLAEQLAERGYVVVNTTYRLVPDAIWPAQLRDVQQAARWMHRQGLAQGIDPERIGSFGYSAGAHLASLVAAVADDPTWGASDTRMRAVVAGGNPADLSLYEGGSLVPAFLGGEQDEIPDTYAAASPITHVSPTHPPVFIYQATLDAYVPFEQALRYKAALDRAGVTNELFIIRGHGHISAFFADDEAIEAAITFLDRHLR